MAILSSSSANFCGQLKINERNILKEKTNLDKQSFDFFPWFNLGFLRVATVYHGVHVTDFIIITKKIVCTSIFNDISPNIRFTPFELNNFSYKQIFRVILLLKINQIGVILMQVSKHTLVQFYVT